MPASSRLRLYGPSLVTLAVLLPFFAYYIRQVQRQGGYLNDRAFRILQVASRQFGAEIRGARDTMLAARKLPQQFALRQRDGVISPEAARAASSAALQAEMESYLNTYIADGQSTLVPNSADSAGSTRQNEPVTERFAICCETATSPAKIRGEVIDRETRIRTDLDPTRMLNRALGDDKSGLFEAVFVATRDGKVIAETSSSTVTVGDVQTLLLSRKNRHLIEDFGDKKGDAKGGDSSASRESALPAQLSGAQERVDVEVSGTSYVAFVVPGPFGLSIDPAGSGAKTDDRQFAVPTAFYGLARKDAFEARAMRLPSLSVPAILFCLIVGIAFLWPVLKLYTMSPKERLKKSSVISMSGITILAAVLLGGLYLLYGFSISLSDRNDYELKSLSGAIRDHVAVEVQKGIQTSRSVMAELVGTQTPVKRGETATAALDRYFVVSKLLKLLSDSKEARSKEARQALLRYPFFAHIILTGAGAAGHEAESNERQIIKLSAVALPTPLIDLPAARYPFLDRFIHGKYASLNRDQHFTLESILSTNTGEFLPVMMFDIDPTLSKQLEAYNRGGGSGFRIMLASHFPSLVNVVFPRNFGFAVVDEQGMVLFHSETSRSLRENFFGESEDTADLRELMKTKTEKYLSIRYGGRPVRTFVRSLGNGDSERNDSDPAADPRIQNLGLSLITFYDRDYQDALFASISKDFLMWGIGLPLFVFIAYVVWSRAKQALFPPSQIIYLRTRVWPWEAEKPFYVMQGIWGVMCFFGAVIIAVTLRVAASTHPALALQIPVVLVAVLIVCLIGLLLLWRKHAVAQRLSRGGLLQHWTHRMPLSAAYSLGLFGSGLGMSGILLLIVFQGFLSVVQLEDEVHNYQSLAESLKNRMERNMQTATSLFPSATGGSGQALPEAGTEFYQASVAGEYAWLGVYDRRTCTSKERILPTLQQNFIARLVRRRDSVSEPLRFQRTDQASPTINERTLPCAPLSRAGFETTPVWTALPSPFDSWTRVLFYFGGLNILALIYLWLHSVVRRLFILDHREPDPLPSMDARGLNERIESALGSDTDKLQRVLLFAHPRSGTGLAVQRIVADLKSRSRLPAEFGPINFADVLIGDEQSATEFRKSAVAANVGREIAILDNFEVRLVDDKDRTEKLALLEALMYANKPNLYVITSIDPFLLMESLLIQNPRSRRLRLEMNRWIRLLGNFERFAYDDKTLDADFYASQGLLVEACEKMDFKFEKKQEVCDIFNAELKPTVFLRRSAKFVQLEKLDYTSPRQFEQSLVAQVREVAEDYYRVIWMNSSSDERLALYQLAKDDWLNPLNKVAISHLLRKKLIGKGAPNDSKSSQTPDGAYRLINESFRQFVLDAVEERELAAWAKEQNLSVWPSMRIALMLGVVLVFLFISYVRRDIFDVYFSYFIALAGGGAALFRVIVQFFRSDDLKVASALAGSGDKTASG